MKTFGLTMLFAVILGYMFPDLLKTVPTEGGNILASWLLARGVLASWRRARGRS